MSLAVRVTRSFAHAGRLEEFARVCDFPIAPAQGMLVTFPDGAEGVVARVRAWLRSSAPGIYDVGVDAQMIAEPGERLQAALVAGWAPAEPPA